jgi:hypothetical protein
LCVAFVIRHTLCTYIISSLNGLRQAFSARPRGCQVAALQPLQKTPLHSQWHTRFRLHECAEHRNRQAAAVAGTKAPSALTPALVYIPTCALLLLVSAPRPATVRPPQSTILKLQLCSHDTHVSILHSQRLLPLQADVGAGPRDRQAAGGHQQGPGPTGGALGTARRQQGKYVLILLTVKDTCA